LQALVGILGGIIAAKKGRNLFFWGLICFIFPLSVLIIGILPPVLKSGATKQCPYCKKIIRGAASECSSCGKEMPINLVKCEECGSFVPEGDFCMQCKRKLKN
jgi:ribosomal protein L32